MDRTKYPVLIASRVAGANYIGSPDFRVAQLFGYVDVTKDFGASTFDSFEVALKNARGEFVGEKIEVFESNVTDALRFLESVAEVGQSTIEVDGIKVKQFKVDNAARIRGNRRG